MFPATAPSRTGETSRLQRNTERTTGNPPRARAVWPMSLMCHAAPSECSKVAGNDLKPGETLPMLIRV